MFDGSQTRGSRRILRQRWKAISIVQSANPLSQKPTVSRSPAQIAEPTHNTNLIVAQTGSRQTHSATGIPSAIPKTRQLLCMESRREHAVCRRPGDNNWNH